MPTELQMPPETPGEVAYRAYGDNRGWKTANGGDMPRWADQRPELQVAWAAAAEAVFDHARAIAIATAMSETLGPGSPRALDSAAAHGGREYATVRVIAEPELGPGGAPHRYAMMWYPGKGAVETLEFTFQKGAIQEVGINGITHESLLLVIIDRLEHFQRGPYPCVENECALRHARASLEWLNTRTLKREARGVEGRTEA